VIDNVFVPNFALTGRRCPICEFASFFVHDKAAKLPIEKRYLIGDLRSHSVSMELLGVKYGHPDCWREAEWTGNDARDLVVRANGNSSELMATVLGDFATRDSFLAYALEKLPDGLTTLYLRGATVPEKIKLPDGLTTLDLSGATVPEKIKLPDGLTTLYLSYATVPEKIKLPDGLTTLDLSGARGASKLIIRKSTKVIR
jgi:hypothetical protein